MDKIRAHTVIFMKAEYVKETLWEPVMVGRLKDMLLMPVLHAMPMSQALAKAILLRQILYVMGKRTIRVLEMIPTLPERVMVMPPVLAERGVVLQIETLLLPMEPCVTDTCPVHVKGFLPAVHVAWPQCPAPARDRIKKVLAAKAAITAPLPLRAVKKVCIEIFCPRYFLSGVFY